MRGYQSDKTDEHVSAPLFSSSAVGWVICSVTVLFTRNCNGRRSSPRHISSGSSAGTTGAVSTYNFSTTSCCSVDSVFCRNVDGKVAVKVKVVLSKDNMRTLSVAVSACE